MRRSADRLLPASLVSVLVGAIGAPELRAQDLPANRRLELAQGLAREFGFTELATALVEDLKKSKDVNEEQLAFVLASLLRDAIGSSAPGLTSVDVAERGAAYRERLAAYDKAIDSFDGYLADKNRTYQRSDAARDMLRIVREKLDITLFWLDTDTDQAADVKAHLVDSAVERQVSGRKRWQAAISHADIETGAIEKKIEALYDALTGDEEKDAPILEQITELETALARLQFEKGEIYLAQYKLLTSTDAKAGDAKSFLDVATRTFREIADTTGDSSNAGMYATARQAECLLYGGRTKDSLRFFTRVFDAALPRPKPEEGKEFDPYSLEPLREQWALARDDQKMSPAEYQGYARSRRLPMCQAYENAIRLFRQKGFLPEALDIANQFLEERRRWKLATDSGEPALRELGNFDAAYKATLEAGIVLSLAGRTGSAIELIWTVAQANLDPLAVRPTNLLGRKAIDAMRQIATHVEEGQLNAEQFRAAAIAAYLDKDHRAAITLFRKALKRFGEGGPSSQIVEAETFLVICYDTMARSFNALAEAGEPRRHLAAMAARNGALHFFEDDERYTGDTSPRCSVTKYYRGVVQKIETEDPASVKFCERWKDEANVLGSLRCNEGQVELAISDATKDINADRFERAAATLRNVTETEHRAYFQVQALIGRCLYQIALQAKAEDQKPKALEGFQKATQQFERALADLAKRKEDEKKKGKVFAAAREATYVEFSHYYAALSYRELLELVAEGEKGGVRKKAIDHFRDASTDPWQNATIGTVSMSFGIPLLIEEKEIEEARTWFAKLDEKVGGTNPRALAGPAYALFVALKPEVAPDTDFGLEPRFDAKTYELFKQTAHYLGRMNAGSQPRFSNLWLEARYLTEIAKTGAPGVAETALQKWLAIASAPEAQNEKLDGFRIPIARTRLLIGGLENYREAAATFAAKCFYPWTRDAKGAQDWSSAQGWNATRRKMSIKLRDKIESEYLLDGVYGSDLALCATAHAGSISPNLREPGKPPVPVLGLGELLVKANPSGKEELATAIRAHQLGKEIWGYLLSLEKKIGTEAYLELHLNYFYAKALLAKTLDPNTRDLEETRSQLRTFNEISSAGLDWEKFPSGYKTADGKEIPAERQKAWRAAYIWLERFVGA